MNETEKYLLDAAIDLAVTKEFDEFTKLDAGDTELLAALDKRVRGILRRKKFAQFCMDNIRVVAATCLCILVAGIGIGVPLYVESTENDYYMQTEQDMYRSSISVQFLCKEEEAPVEKILKPNSAAEVLADFSLVRTYSTESVYIEEYDGVRYEQTALHAEGQYIITPPKTEKGIRRVLMPDFYADKMQAYIESLQLNENDRIFPFTKSHLHHEIRRGCSASGVKRIRIHGIRHSHISLLIDMGFSAVAIADRVGHESIDITYRYAHVFPSTQQDVADKLGKLFMNNAQYIEK